MTPGEMTEKLKKALGGEDLAETNFHTNPDRIREKTTL